MQKLWQNTCYLQLGGLNNCFFYNFCSAFEYLQSKIGGMAALFAPTWLRAWQQ